MSHLLLLAALVSPEAEAASRIVFGSDLPVRVYVDGEQIHYTNQLKMVADDLTPGAHDVAITTLLGRSLHQETLQIDADTELQLRWRSGQLEALNSYPVPGGGAPVSEPEPLAAAPADAAEPADVSALQGPVAAAPIAPNTSITPNTSTAPTEEPEPAAATEGVAPPAIAAGAPVREEELAAPLTGGALSSATPSDPMRGASRLAAVATSQGEVLIYQLEGDGVAIQLRGERAATVELRGAEMRVESGAGTVLVQLESGADAPTAALVGDAPIDASATSAAPGPAPAAAPQVTPAIATGLQTAAPVGPEVTDGLLELISRDGEWANVYVDGAFIAAVSSMQPRATITLSVGSHLLEIVDPRTGERWDAGQLEIRAGEALAVGFGRNEPVEIEGSPELWSSL